MAVAQFVFVRLHDTAARPDHNRLRRLVHPTRVVCRQSMAFALFHTGMVFCYFYIVAAIVGAFISGVSVAMYLDPYVWVRLLGKAGWRISYYFIIVVQPIGLPTGATGATILVRWLTKRSNAPVPK